MNTEKTLSPSQTEDLITILASRFKKNLNRHPELSWEKISVKLGKSPEKIWSLSEMERSGGEPDVVGYENNTDEYLFMDCSPESPKGRRSLCYDREALESRKDFPPENNAMDMAKAMGIEILTEAQYRYLQELGRFDLKTSNWLKTPADIRKLGGAIFTDFRYNHVFVYHNSAGSYYAARGFRGCLKV